jgi:hypothetical protein
MLTYLGICGKYAFVLETSYFMLIPDRILGDSWEIVCNGKTTLFRFIRIF